MPGLQRVGCCSGETILVRVIVGLVLVAPCILAAAGVEPNLQTFPAEVSYGKVGNNGDDVLEADADDDKEFDPCIYPDLVEAGECDDAEGNPRRLGSKWYKYKWEVDYLKSVSTAVMLLITLFFETIFHKVLHWAQHSFQCGQSMMSDKEKQAAADRAVFGKPLLVVWVDRMGSEFMVLGFLAFTIWSSNKLKLFDAVATLKPKDINLPKYGPDYLHLMEDVHMQIFLGMVIYFGLVFRIVRGSNAYIIDFEWCRQTWIDQIMKGTVPADPNDDHKVLKSFKCWRNHFLVGNNCAIAEILQWREKNPDAFEKLLKSLDIKVEAIPVITLESLQQAFIERFSFCTYMSFSVLGTTSDMVQLNKSTIYAVIIIKVILSFIFRYGKITYDSLAIALMVPSTIMVLLIHFLTHKFKVALECKDTASSPWLKRMVTFAHDMTRVINPEEGILKTLELNMFFLCNLAAGNLMDKYFWKSIGKGKAGAIMLLVTNLLTFACMTWSLPRCIPSFGAVMALPPLFSQKNEGMIQVVSCQVVDAKMIQARAHAQARKVEKQAQKFLGMKQKEGMDFHQLLLKTPNGTKVANQLLGKAKLTDDDNVGLLDEEEYEEEDIMLEVEEQSEPELTGKPSADATSAAPSAESTGGTGSTGGATESAPEPKRSAAAGDSAAKKKKPKSKAKAKAKAN